MPIGTGQAHGVLGGAGHLAISGHGAMALDTPRQPTRQTARHFQRQDDQAGRRAAHAAARRDRGRCRPADRPSSPLAEEEPDVPPSVFGTLAVAAVNANEPADVVAGLALRALDGAPKLLPEAVDALAFAERYEEVLSRFGEALADTRRLGSLPHVLGLSCYRALHQRRIGNLADAEADARVALETGPRPPGIHAAVALAALLETVAERGELQAAEAADQRYRLAEQFPTTMQAGWLLAARGGFRLAELHPARPSATSSLACTSSLPRARRGDPTPPSPTSRAAHEPK